MIVDRLSIVHLYIEQSFEQFEMCGPTLLTVQLLQVSDHGTDSGYVLMLAL